MTVKFLNFVCTDLWVFVFSIPTQILIPVHSKTYMLSRRKLFLSIELLNIQFHYKSGNIFRIMIGTYIYQYEI